MLVIWMLLIGCWKSCYSGRYEILQVSGIDSRIIDTHNAINEDRILWSMPLVRFMDSRKASPFFILSLCTKIKVYSNCPIRNPLPISSYQTCSRSSSSNIPLQRNHSSLLLLFRTLSPLLKQPDPPIRRIKRSMPIMQRRIYIIEEVPN